jgi:hypothetical protein
MDLLAYLNGEEIEEVLKKNGIEIPRFRGGNFMASEEKFSNEALEEEITWLTGTIYSRACTSEPRFRPNAFVHECSSATDRMKEKYLLTEEVTEVLNDGTKYVYEKVVGFKWNLVHGKNKKAIKLAVKQEKKALLKSFITHNKYVGRKDVLRIHARIGGNNWEYYGGSDIERQPWFLEKVDDYFDNTYCDIYVRIKEGN